MGTGSAARLLFNMDLSMYFPSVGDLGFPKGPRPLGFPKGPGPLGYRADRVQVHISWCI